MNCTSKYHGSMSAINVNYIQTNPKCRKKKTTLRLRAVKGSMSFLKSDCNCRREPGNLHLENTKLLGILSPVTWSTFCCCCFFATGLTNATFFFCHKIHTKKNQETSQTTLHLYKKIRAKYHQLELKVLTFRKRAIYLETSTPRFQSNCIQ